MVRYKVPRCDLFYFYIKPQLHVLSLILLLVVTYSISTSNHNSFFVNTKLNSVVTYSISTSNHNYFTLPDAIRGVVTYSISTSNHNTNKYNFMAKKVVTYSISTSNHNACNITHLFPESYVVLRQTKRSVRVADEVRLMHFFDSTDTNILKKF